MSLPPGEKFLQLLPNAVFYPADVSQPVPSTSKETPSKDSFEADSDSDSDVDPHDMQVFCTSMHM